jgi:hypothetical protein
MRKNLSDEPLFREYKAEGDPRAYDDNPYAFWLWFLIFVMVILSLVLMFRPEETKNATKETNTPSGQEETTNTRTSVPHNLWSERFNTISA